MIAIRQDTLAYSHPLPVLCGKGLRSFYTKGHNSKCVLVRGPPRVHIAISGTPNRVNWEIIQNMVFNCRNATLYCIRYFV
jgi:hypothetical protein